MKATAKAPANIAFIKYWGKRDSSLRLPLNSSISMNLDNVFTITTVEFSSRLREDKIEMVGEKLSNEEVKRIVSHLDRIRELAKIKQRARVKTKNNFPKGSGISSSASGFAALTLAAASAADLNLSEKKLSALARLGSGSACRSIPDGFVEWVKGQSHQTSYAYSLYPPGYWKLADLVVVVEEKEKRVGSTEGHQRAKNSPFLLERVKWVEEKIREIKRALKKKDFKALGEIIESEALNMHAVMISSSPPLLYWRPGTLKVMLAVQQWRQEGLESYFTIDAGATVHVICRQKDEGQLKKRLSCLKGIKKVIINHPAEGASLLNTHLF